MIRYFSEMFFPETCKACNKALVKGETVICLECEFHLPRTGFHTISANLVAKSFWGKVNIHSATAMYFFDKGDKLQKLLHKLKYNGEKEVGEKLGKLFGAELVNTEFASTIDCIVPVPLHKNKMRLRGYNQSEIIANGISQVLKIPVVTDFIGREIATETQTRKARFQRWENVDNVFEILNNQKIKGKHVLIIDDVITTGSTIAACAEAFLKAENCKVSVAAIAFAHS